MSILRSNIDVNSETYRDNVAAMQRHLDRYHHLLDQAIDGGDRQRAAEHQDGPHRAHGSLPALNGVIISEEP